MKNEAQMTTTDSTRYIVSLASMAARRGTVLTKHIAAGPTGYDVLCGRIPKEPVKLTGTQPQYGLCSACARIARNAR